MNLASPFMSFIVTLLLACSILEATGQEVHSLGVFTGLTIPYTWDDGFNKDPRYRIKYNLKYAPIGVHYGVDRPGFGLTFDPSIFKTGQYFNVINTSGGDVGERKINMTFIHAPIGFKLHMIDMSFFKVSFVASVSAAYMLSGEETITHLDSKLAFPQSTYPILPPDYTVEYDGVLVPNLKDFKLLDKSDFNQLQIYGAIGFRSDWDLSENYRISFDLRGYYGIFDPRKKDYIDRVNSNQTIYDLPGNRRDMFAYLTIGFSRIVEIDEKERKAKTKQRSMSQRGPVQSKYQHLHHSKSKKKHSPPK
ncbi:MAG: outer membrane beta-barrel protein [Cyclobacteriaceae bacterium]|nr:MAG: outer membrane beta-barrel protein [Cyclobacteriaceae bacterium]